jgi:hypothetical protein
MKTALWILLCLLTLQASAQDSEKTNTNTKSNTSTKNIRSFQTGDQRIDYYSTWTERTAKVVPDGEIHLSALAVSRYGNYPKTEINSQLLLFPLVPNVGVKHEWYGKNTIFSTQHTFYYPTLGLKWAKSSGFQDQISESSVIPQIFTFRNEIIVSHIINPQPKDCFIKVPDLVLTARLGFDFSLISGNSDFSLMDYHFLYHRTASYHNHQKLYFTGLELDGNLYKNYNFSINADYYSIDFNGEYALESQGKIHWHRNSKFSLSGGYKMYYLNSDYGTQFFAMPIIDLVFKLNHHTRLQNGLFK